MAAYSFPALDSILRAEEVLGQVLGPHVYVGGACVGFYVDDPGAAETRPTDDVDVIVEVTTEAERTTLDEALRTAGLLHDMEGPICRWRLNGLKIDIMPTRSEVLGFSNAWYPEALAGAETLEVRGFSIKIPHVCTFIATKIEAFAGRGNGDFILSSDFEDIVRILDGCSWLSEARRTCPAPVRTYLKETFEKWRQLRDFEDAVSAHLMDDGAGGRASIVYEQMELFS